MEHLTLEALARLVDENPEPAEAAHLDACAACREELDTLAEQSRALGALPDIEPPPHAWPALEARLGREGLLRQDDPTQPTPRAIPGSRPASWWRPHLGRAAAIALFFLGGAAGFTVRGTIGATHLAEATGGTGLRVTAERPRSAGAGGSVEAAARAVRAAEAEYLGALTRYAELVEAPATADPVARLAALESIVRTTRAALGQVPADPVINGYHLTAVAQREAMLRQFTAATDDNWF